MTILFEGNLIIPIDCIWGNLKTKVNASIVLRIL